MKYNRLFEGCGKEGPIRCIFLCEFHSILGPKILHQVPENIVTKKMFEAVSTYIIPKAKQLFNNIVTINVSNKKILGFPAVIDNSRYQRNYYLFNVCFVVDSWARSVPYVAVVKKLSEYLQMMEIESDFLSSLEFFPSNVKKLVHILTKVRIDLNSTKKCRLTEISFNKSHVATHLKILPLPSDPPQIFDYEVPVFKDPHELPYSDQWDLTTSQILHHINGVNHVMKISAIADVDVNFVKSCLQNLVYYRIIHMIPIFQYSNMYMVTSKLLRLAINKKAKEECISAVTRHKGKKTANFTDIFQFYSNMKCGITLKDLCIRFNPVGIRIDERNLVQHGIIRGYIRRIYQYPVLMEGTPSSDEPLMKFFTGDYSTDQICCAKEMSFSQLEKIISNYPNVSLLCK